jgi:hypothetical protein
LWRRYWIAVVISGLGFFSYSFAELSKADTAERLTKSVSVGEFVGLTFGLIAVVAAEIPERLFRLWPIWLRFIVSFVLGTALGTLPWVMIFLVFYLFTPTPDDWNSILLGGFSVGLAFALRSTVRVPAWVATIWAAIIIYIPLYLTWVNFMPPLLYTRPEEHINQYAISIAVLVAVGIYAQGLLSEARHLWRRLWQSS